MHADSKPKTKNSKLVTALLDWFALNARDLPWRRTRDPYAIWVSEIMLQQTQVKTVIPFWNRWMQALPTIKAAAQAPAEKIHKLWEGLGYYTRVRNLQKAAQVIGEKHSGRFPETFDDVLALPGIGRYTAGAICSIAYNQPTPILDGNVMRVLTRVFGIDENPKAKATNARLWKLAEELVQNSKFKNNHSKLGCSHLNQSLMELGALICTPRQPQCDQCPVNKLCVAFKEGRVNELPNLGKREAATARRFIALTVERAGTFFVRQRPAGGMNAHLWEFPNAEVTDAKPDPQALFQNIFGRPPPAELRPLATVKHAITRYRITLEAFHVRLGGTKATRPKDIQYSTSNIQPSRLGTWRTRPAGKKTDANAGDWKTPAQMRALAFTSAHRKILRALNPDENG